MVSTYLYLYTVSVPFCFSIVKVGPSRPSMLSSFPCFTFSNRVGWCVLESNLVWQAASNFRDHGPPVLRLYSLHIHVFCLRSEQPQVIHKLLPAALFGLSTWIWGFFFFQILHSFSKNKNIPPRAGNLTLSATTPRLLDSSRNGATAVDTTRSLATAEWCKGLDLTRCRCPQCQWIPCTCRNDDWFILVLVQWSHTLCHLDPYPTQ